jgi:hypothetical protein
MAIMGDRATAERAAADRGILFTVFRRETKTPIMTIALTGPQFEAEVVRWFEDRGEPPYQAGACIHWSWGLAVTTIEPTTKPWWRRP